MDASADQGYDRRMTASRAEALAAAQKLLRMFTGAPEPRRQARAIHSTLAAARGWSAAEQSLIDDFGSWLADGPAEAVLQPRCKDVVHGLRISRG